MTNKSFNSKIAISAVVLLTLSGCAREISSNVYKASHVGEASFTYQGIIASARVVKIDEGEYLEQNSTGIALGAVGGGVAGHQIGHGKGNIAATAAGALLGGVAGAYAEKALKSQEAMEYAVQLTNGSMMTIVQGKDLAFPAGQRVLVMVSQDGRSRVVADNSPVQEAQPLVIQPQTKIVISDRHRY